MTLPWLEFSSLYNARKHISDILGFSVDYIHLITNDGCNYSVYEQRTVGQFKNGPPLKKLSQYNLKQIGENKFILTEKTELVNEEKTEYALDEIKQLLYYAHLAGQRLNNNEKNKTSSRRNAIEYAKEIINKVDIEKLLTNVNEEKTELVNEEKTDGQKFDSDKIQVELFPPEVILEISKVLTFGAKKYSPDNWKKVENFDNRYYGALLRHLLAWRSGENLDPESGLSHLAHAGCCLVFLIYGNTQRIKKPFSQILKEFGEAFNVKK